MTLTVLDPGGLTLVQDLGRPGYAGLGVTESGAADRRSLRRANRLLGNDDGAPALETTLGGLVLRAEETVVVALAGAPAPIEVVAGGGSTRTGGPVLRLPAGAELRLGVPEWGMRTYLALPQGVLTGRTLGSASYDTLAALGPPPLQAGDVLQAGAGEAVIATVEAEAPGWHGAPYMLDLLPGPRRDWFTDGALTALFAEPYTVTDLGDRVGVRLHGAGLERARRGELASEGVVRGAVQVPADGQPLIFGPDHPVTGGYPVIGVLTDDAADASGQLRPGGQIRFRRRGDW
ncbi:biotin-dependent carboxyltransferase family protein [Ruania zhangjianzhongii]|uniref:5-oxoprolinase subunit C family protein n=1 Tax=Ruania zhangjianzhongii TaxID=2603206 RepID=UPI0011C9B51C|nr:biotin-dependent carboxyltransferase family protein [Ruania zhangjianzhongii]